MFDAHSCVRQALAAWLGTVLGRAVAQEAFRCHDPRAAVSSPLALLYGLDAPALAQALCAAPPPLLGVDAVSSVRARNHHLHFIFTPAFYDALLARAEEGVPLPAPVWDRRDSSARAMNRMLILAQAPGATCPDEHARRALWLTLGAADSALSPRAQYLRAKQAARALLYLGRHLPPARRPAYLKQCGGLARCCAKLLSWQREKQPKEKPPCPPRA